MRYESCSHFTRFKNRGGGGFLNSTRHLNPDQNITEFGGEILLDHGLFAASLVSLYHGRWKERSRIHHHHYGTGFRVIGNGAQLIGRRSYYSSKLMIPLGNPFSIVCSNYRAMAMLALREGGSEEYICLFFKFIAGRFWGLTGSIVFYPTYCCSILKSQSVGIYFPLSFSSFFWF